jgi:hypothetical protein
MKKPGCGLSAGQFRCHNANALRDAKALETRFAPLLECRPCAGVARAML